MREGLDRIRLIISESGRVGDGWGSRLSGESRLRVIWDNLWNKSLIICPYSWETEFNPGAPTRPHLTVNPEGCYQCACENYQGVDQDGEDVWLF